MDATAGHIERTPSRRSRCRAVRGAHAQAALAALGMLVGGCTADARTDPCATVTDVDAGTAFTDPSSFMNEALCRAGERTLTLADLCWVRSHDAGNYVESACVFPASANACNTRTQTRDVAGQLAAGARAFDVRVHRAYPGEIDGFDLPEPRYFTHHTAGCGQIGCLGAPLDEVLADVRDFVDTHRELVLLELGAFCQTDAADGELLAMIENTLGPRLYREPDGESRPLLARPLASLLPSASTTGRVIVLYDGLADDVDARRSGRFPRSFLPVSAHWTNTTDIATLRADQTARFASFVADGTTLFEMSWTLTQNADLALACAVDPATATSIADLAAIANPALATTLAELEEAGEVRAGRIPNVLSVDSIEPALGALCLHLVATSTF